MPFLPPGMTLSFTNIPTLAVRSPLAMRTTQSLSPASRSRAASHDRGTVIAIPTQNNCQLKGSNARANTPMARTFTTMAAQVSGGSSGRCGGGTGNWSPRWPWWRDEGGRPESPFVSLSRSAIIVALARRRTPQFDPWQPNRRRPEEGLQQLLQSIRISHVLLALNVAVFALQTLYGPALLTAGAKVNSAIAAGEYYRLFSPMFLHASVSHLMVNSFSLHSTGPSVESWFGKARFLSLYIASGVSGNVLSFLCSPVPAVGASGAIFGLVGASVVILSRHHRILGPRARRGLQSLAYIVLMNFGMGMAPGSRVDNFGHLGGFLGGIMYSYLCGPRLVPRRSRSGRTVLRDAPILSVALSELRGRVRQMSRMLKGR